jgi:hypothetical protein
MAVLNRVCHEPHRPLDEINVDMPLELAELVDCLLAKEPAKRPEPPEVEARCADLLSSLQQGRRPRRRGRLAAAWRRRAQWKQPLAVAGAVAAALVCVGLGAWLSGPVLAPVGEIPSAVERPQVAKEETKNGTRSVPATTEADTFDRDLAGTLARVAEIEAARTLPGEENPSPGADAFLEEVTRLQSLLWQLESERTARSANDSSFDSPPVEIKKD